MAATKSRAEVYLPTRGPPKWTRQLILSPPLPRNFNSCRSNPRPKNQPYTTVYRSGVVAYD
ncbi:hypothetical protein PVAG01_11008 [Phlyctema vagabunda]|uniref:Uncharacterized protein n=1 Tax=Phlyctema vagabunda TaxID=108571 RepID=A0ABR4P3X7_9HELO